MFDEDSLALRLNVLKPPEVWAPKRQGLTFLLPNGGDGEYVSGPVAQPLSTGDVLILNGRRAGRVCAPRKGRIVFWSFSLRLEHLFPLLAPHEISLLKQFAESLKVARRYPASSLLARECHWLGMSAPPPGNVDHRSHLLRIAAAVLTAEFKVAQSQQVGVARIRNPRTQKFEELSLTEFSTLSVEGLARKFGYSRRHLNRLIHQQTGSSITSLRMEMRLMKALTLLRDPESRIYNVAKQCGFSHLGLFHTCFKKRFGKTPGECRTAAAQAEGTHKSFNRADYEFYEAL